MLKKMIDLTVIERKQKWRSQHSKVHNISWNICLHRFAVLSFLKIQKLLWYNILYLCAGNFKRSPGYSPSLKDNYHEKEYPRKERHSPSSKDNYGEREYPRKERHSPSSKDNYGEREYPRKERRSPSLKDNYQEREYPRKERRSPSSKDSYQEREYPRKERRQLFTKEKSSEQYSHSENDSSTEDDVKDPRLMQYEKWYNIDFDTFNCVFKFCTVCIRLYDIRKYKESQRTPNFLTWKTKEEIRILYKEDPENWNLERLASKYPVSKASVKVKLNNFILLFSLILMRLLQFIFYI
jgi:hypothetical protein